MNFIIPHNYCLLVWGSNVFFKGHKLHLLQKNALTILPNDEYLAYMEPICKEFSIIRLIDMFCLSIWKFYYKLINNALPPYFHIMKPVLPRIVNLYEIRKPSFHLPKIRHEFAEHLIEYCLINC